MKHPLVMMLCVVLLVSCSKNDPVRRCNYLLNVNVDLSINLNLPQYSQLQFTGNTVFIPNYGNAGIYISRIGNQFRAFDAADPSHGQSSCSTLTNESGVGTCGCQDENQYSLLTGQPMRSNQPCGLKEYRVESAGGNMLRIYN
ncbi:MAG TPA: hypothetical protein PKL92_04705 [Aquaticitalea sp.]|nr:hypothetical protein [Aquaticitalea sp.]HNU59943.1 hypothetical protein [Aquaticitalea sp.]